MTERKPRATKPQPAAIKETPVDTSVDVQPKDEQVQNDVQTSAESNAPVTNPEPQPTPQAVAPSPAPVVAEIPNTIEEFLKARGIIEAPIYPEPFASWVRTIKVYSEEMRPGKTATPQIIGKNQRALYTLILSILNSPTHVSVQGMDLLMFWISKNTNTLFAMDYVLRSAGLRMDRRETLLFQDMITLFINSYEPGSRHLILKQFSLERILNALPTPVAQENFAHYYTS